MLVHRSEMFAHYIARQPYNWNNDFRSTFAFRSGQSDDKTAKGEGSPEYRAEYKANAARHCKPETGSYQANTETLTTIDECTGDASVSFQINGKPQDGTIN